MVQRRIRTAHKMNRSLTSNPAWQIYINFSSNYHRFHHPKTLNFHLGNPPDRHSSQCSRETKVRAKTVQNRQVRVTAVNTKKWSCFEIPENGKTSSNSTKFSSGEALQEAVSDQLMRVIISIRTEQPLKCGTKTEPPGSANDRLTCRRHVEVGTN